VGFVSVVDDKRRAKPIDVLALVMSVNPVCTPLAPVGDVEVAVECCAGWDGTSGAKSAIHPSPPDDEQSTHHCVTPTAPSA